MSTKTQTFSLKTHKWRAKAILGAVLALISIFLIVPIFDKNFYTHLILQCSFTSLIIFTLYTLDGQKVFFSAGLLLLLPLIYFDSKSFSNESFVCLTLASFFSALFTLLAIAILMKKILHARLVSSELIFAALMVYLFAGILWANIYFIQNLLTPGSFQGAGLVSFEPRNFSNIYEQQFNFLYYSFATLATLGMGDITPLNHLAKSLTALEAMFGQLFVAIIIAKLVSVWWYVSPPKSDG